MAKGFLQREHVDYEETFAPVAKLATIRTLLAIANTEDLLVFQVDVRTAFLNGQLQEKVYMTMPEGLPTGNGEVCLLKRSLYGLKQSSRCWNKRFNEFLVSLGFQRSRHDYCLYVKEEKENSVYLVIYVDDLLIAGKDARVVRNIQEKLKKEFEMADMGEVHHFLGIKVERKMEEGLMTLSQTGQIDKLLLNFGMEQCNPVKTPAEPNLHLEKFSGECKNPYRELIGGLMYIMMGTRPDLCYIVGYLARFQDAAGEQHWQQAKRVLRYLQGTKTMKLTYQKNRLLPAVHAFADADYASDEIDRKCVSGYLMKVYGNTVIWSSKKQQTVAMSSTEAEYVAMSSCTSEAIWLGGLLNDLMPLKNVFPIQVSEDNQGAIAMSKTEETKRVKHIDVKHHFIRDAVGQGKIKIHYVPTCDQEADILTKSLTIKTFEDFRRRIGLL